MEGQEQRADQKWQPTAAVLAGGLPVYLRAGANGHLHLLHCLRFDAAEMVATLEWPADSDEQPPAAGTSVQLYLRRPQSLSVAAGAVQRLDAGQPPLLVVRAEPRTRVYPLRLHPRYQAWGRLRLGEPAEADYFYYNDDLQQLNVSEGGFGVRIASRGWHLGDTIRFALEAQLSDEPDEAGQWPVLKLRGLAALRSRAALRDDPDREHFGFAFVDLTDYQQEVLRLWLTAIHVYHRQR